MARCDSLEADQSAAANDLENETDTREITESNFVPDEGRKRRTRNRDSNNEELCRLCATNNSNNQLIPLFHGEGLEHKLPKRIQQYLPFIKINEDDDLPHVVCYDCATILISWHTLYKGCTTAENKLRDLLNIKEENNESSSNECNVDGSVGDSPEPLKRMSTRKSTRRLTIALKKGKNSYELKYPAKTRHRKSDDTVSKSAVVNAKKNRQNGMIIPSDLVISELLDEQRRPTSNCEDYDDIADKANDSDEKSSKSQPFACDRCNKKFSMKKSLRKHMKKIHEIDSPGKRKKDEEGKIECNLCHQTFRRKYNLKRHTRVVHEHQPDVFTCHHCGKNLKRKVDVVTHIQTTHENNDNPFGCDHCDMHFRSPYFLSLHVSREHKTLTDDEIQDEFEHHSCPHCLRIFKRQYDCERHVKLHSDKNDFTNECIKRLKLYCCDVCGVGSQFRSNLVMHREKEHDIYEEPSWQVYQNMHAMAERCDSCKRYIDKRLSTHSCDSHPAIEDENFSNRVTWRNNYYCNLCGIGFPWKWDLRMHREKHFLDNKVENEEYWEDLKPSPPKYLCSGCEKGFDDQFKLTEHFCALGKWKETNLTCDICDKSFPRRSELISHRKRRHQAGIISRISKEALICPYCPFESFLRQVLLDHVKTEHNIILDSPFACIKCNKVFRGKDKMIVHNMAYHPNDNDDENVNSKILLAAEVTVNGEKSYCCEICKHIEADSLKFLAHYRYHTIERAFTCDTCGKQFRTKYQLDQHIDHVHNNVRIYNCEVCHKSFYRKQSLIDHMRIHTGEKPYQCEVCGKEFGSNCQLRDHHKYRHSDFYPYCCSQCPKKFKIRRCLMDHLRTHTGERPFKCDLCPKTYNNKSRFAYHKKVTHSEHRPFKCTICGNAFKANTFLQRHIKRHETRPAVQHRRPHHQVSVSPAMAMRKRSIDDESELELADTANYYELPQHMDNRSVVRKPITHHHHHQNIMPFNLNYSQYSLEDGSYRLNIGW